MKRMTVLVGAAFLLLVAGVQAAEADIVIAGVLKSAVQPAQIDSVFLQYETQNEWIATPGWSVAPAGQDTALFSEFPGWPEMMMLAAYIEQQPWLMTIPQPLRDMWYQFDPPFDQVMVKFYIHAGVQELGENPRRGVVLAVSPSIISNAALIAAMPVAGSPATVEILDAAGNHVRSVAEGVSASTLLRWSRDDDSGRLVPEGIYFCRLSSAGSSTVRKLIVAN